MTFDQELKVVKGNGMWTLTFTKEGKSREVSFGDQNELEKYVSYFMRSDTE